MPETLEVAKEIRRQINALDRRALMAWGAKDFIGSDESRKLMRLSRKGDTPSNIVEIGPSLSFSVNGPKFRGKIFIALQPNDEYTVLAVRMTNYLDREIGVRLTCSIMTEEHSGIYAEQLVDVIDGIVG